MAGAKNHPYHLVKPSVWPLIGATSALLLFGGLVLWMHDNPYGPWVFFTGVLGVVVTMFSWWADVIHEAHTGDHTPVVQLHLRYGMILFIASEVMFFVAWFWAYFSAALFPAEVEAVGGVWPPEGTAVMDPFGWPLLNTMILLCSGTTVTWAHHALINNDRKGLITGLWLTILLGATFTAVQAYEYWGAGFLFVGEVAEGATIYGSTFMMATGFHGAHVIIGTIFLTVCLFRAYAGHFRPDQHFGFEAAAWYWHFVDVVWLFLFIFVYVWGGWGAEYH